MIDPIDTEETVPMASLLGYLGLVPFIAGAILALLTENFADWAARGFLIYSVSILSFMGGVHWGLILANAKELRIRLLASVLPVLVSWLSAWLLREPYAVAVLGAGYIVQWRVDKSILATLLIPRWYIQLRPRLTYVAAGCHLLVLFRLLG